MSVPNPRLQPTLTLNSARLSVCAIIYAPCLPRTQINKERDFLELKEGKFWVHRDGTSDGVTGDLLKAGIPKERIVLTFQHLVRRERGEFAVS